MGTRRLIPVPAETLQVMRSIGLTKLWNELSVVNEFPPGYTVWKLRNMLKSGKMYSYEQKMLIGAGFIQ